MKKRLLLLGMAVLLVLSLSAFMGCSQGDDDDDDEAVDHTSLVNAVYGGETMSPNWMTLTFLADGKVICSFRGNDGGTSSTNHWDYSYYKSSRAGDLVNPGGGSTPGAFAISADGKTLSFTNLFNNHGPKDIKRLRAPDKTIDSDPYTFASGSGSDDLAGTIYGGENPGGNWVTFAFKTGNKVAVAFASGTGSTNDWSYTYDGYSNGDDDDEGKFTDATGPFTNGGGTQFFNIKETNDTVLECESFMGSPRSFKRYR
ncbi:MAG: hypothetical protein LBT33_00200 [Spirochaetia bacterium]|jgi:hypothetical protein|nr:hypothetical protein [Spirochaetia bacterium]